MSTTTGADKGGHSATPLSTQLCHWVGSLCRWVTARRLPGRHTSVAVRCATRLDFLRGAVPREDRHLVSSGGLFARRHMLDTGELKRTLVKRVGTRG